ncbi:unnamed protein product, partial [Nippostrongylus brasiliensis]|uniref:Integrase_H2C2 domain-containing protein n=1 Tax=Nippostrongylus brasiliensis TaxID=27835 RepID=A0A0N4Y142_NIPBR
HQLTSLIIEQYHKQCGHQVTNTTLANIRQKYWIPRGRQSVKKCLRNCLQCKIWSSKPYRYSDSPALPSCRSQPSRPFSHIGIDFAGPFKVVDTDNENKEQKRWVCLFTCTATRTVHLETVKDTSTKQFIKRLRRFVARRRQPSYILSDNASNFTAGKEAVINSRPLTYPGSTVEDSVVLRPIDFLVQNANIYLIHPQFEEKDEDYMPTISNKQEAVRYYQKLQEQLAYMWKRWRDLYLLELRNHHQTKVKLTAVARAQHGAAGSKLGRLTKRLSFT